MKILMVAIPNHHFFQWVNQLKDSGYDVYWFDIKDGGEKVSRISWVNQIKGWKLRYDFPFRHTLKKKFPELSKWISKYNERKLESVFEKLLLDIKPDVVHCFEMKLGGLPILEIMNKYPNQKFMYSSWGSDIYFYKEIGILQEQFESFLQRADFLITDCHRDYEIAKQNGFKNNFLGVYIGNGGLDIKENDIQKIEDRKTIIIKGYEDGVGKAIEVIEAIELLSFDELKNFEFIIYSTDQKLKEYIENSIFFSSLNVKIFIRGQFIANSDLLQIMGKSILHIANSISDGLPTSGVEAMAMGAFPIQSNPGKVSEEVITHGQNGYLIDNPFDSVEISKWIKMAIDNFELRASAQDYNTAYVDRNFNRMHLQKEIVQLYQTVYRQ
ncbi:glycosyltransferase family 4 protein [Flavobacterium panacagri]|uniref:glycosyltransferase family 4 protein n=1 Tax=Flavobacterium panacagri TaxID=3034146 RepID=UPI0025A54914|nr:glycosyltransferase family 4 protein [Flavobacterium panacagri]